MALGLKLTDTDFHKFSHLIREKAGIRLHEDKKQLVQSRLAKIIREENFDSFRSYYQHVIQDETGYEITRMLDFITTNLTSFFREPLHFSFMAKTLIPELIDMVNQGNPPRLRLWSAGCATGEEVYSLAITLLDTLPQPENWDIKILGTDLSTTSLRTALKGIYPTKKVAGLPKATLRRYFQKGGSEKTKNLYKVKDEVRRLAYFRFLNLKNVFPFKNPFNVIFCRNVMIYFDKDFQRNLVNRFYRVLAKGGYLFVGHSESLSWLQSAFKYIKPAIYKK
ncbi:MAG: protein-glutamate O-methyltransferase CheR [Deltaproteobacteria bacterium]|nr:protein-glutamate O-methyltransferase CheR [Deltaproteobacteria bacterium]